jgi:hypothetical protein
MIIYVLAGGISKILIFAGNQMKLSRKSACSQPKLDRSKIPPAKT